MYAVEGDVFGTYDSVCEKFMSSKELQPNDFIKGHGFPDVC